MVTQVSCKLLNSLLNYAERQGASLNVLFEFFDGPEEFLRDPHFWIDIHQAEGLLTKAARTLGDPGLGAAVGTQCVELASFGALDNVFKMMPAPKDYYTNLGRFFSYFVAPMPEFREKEMDSKWVRFAFPFVGAEFPQVTAFLRAVLENLPRYTGHPAAQSEWDPELNEMFVTWDTHQASLFADEPGQVVNPRLIQTLSAQLEASERALHSKIRETQTLKSEVQQLRFDMQNQTREKIYSEKMAGLAQLAAGVAHEINNPLSFVMSNLGRMEEYFGKIQRYVSEMETGGRPHTASELKKALDIDFILQETPAVLNESTAGLRRVKEIVKDLSALAHPQEGRTAKKILADLNGLLESSLKVFQDEINDQIKVEKILDLKSPVRVFPVRMSQVFMNLLSNAIHAVGGKGAITIHTRQENNQAVVEISDNGVGMDDAVMARIFTPFFTTKEVGKGTGLGLSIAHSIVEMHRGQILVKSEKGKGSRLTVKIPIQEAGA